MDTADDISVDVTNVDTVEDNVVSTTVLVVSNSSEPVGNVEIIIPAVGSLFVDVEVSETIGSNSVLVSHFKLHVDAVVVVVDVVSNVVVNFTADVVPDVASGVVFDVAPDAASDVASDVISDVVSDIVCDIVCDVVCDVVSDVVSNGVCDIVPGVVSDVICDVVSNVVSDVVSDVVSGVVTDIVSVVVVDVVVVVVVCDVVFEDDIVAKVSDVAIDVVLYVEEEVLDEPSKIKFNDFKFYCIIFEDLCNIF